MVSQFCDYKSYLSLSSIISAAIMCFSTVFAENLKVMGNAREEISMRHTFSFPVFNTETVDVPFKSNFLMLAFKEVISVCTIHL